MKFKSDRQRRAFFSRFLHRKKIPQPPKPEGKIYKEVKNYDLYHGRIYDTGYKEVEDKEYKEPKPMTKIKPASYWNKK